jgi:hypothetical protein
MQGKGVFVVMTVDARADLEKSAEVVSEPTYPISTGILSIPGFADSQGSTISTA